MDAPFEELAKAVIHPPVADAAPGSALQVVVALVVHLLDVDLVDDVLKTTASKALAGKDEGLFPKGRIAR